MKWGDDLVSVYEHDGIFCGGGDANDMQYDPVSMDNQINGDSTAAVAPTAEEVTIPTAPAVPTASSSADATAPLTVPPLPPSIKPSSCQHTAQSYGYGGMPSQDFETGPTNRDPAGSNNDIQKTLNWSRARCVPRMVNLFVYMINEFLDRDKFQDISLMLKIPIGSGDWRQRTLTKKYLP